MSFALLKLFHPRATQNKNPNSIFLLSSTAKESKPQSVFLLDAIKRKAMRKKRKILQTHCKVYPRAKKRVEDNKKALCVARASLFIKLYSRYLIKIYCERYRKAKAHNSAHIEILLNVAELLFALSYNKRKLRVHNHGAVIRKILNCFMETFCLGFCQSGSELQSHNLVLYKPEEINDVAGSRDL